MSNTTTQDPVDTTRRLRRPLETVGFWTAVALPFLYLPLLLSGPLSGAETTAAVALIALHAVTLVVGHAHNT